MPVSERILAALRVWMRVNIAVFVGGTSARGSGSRRKSASKNSSLEQAL